MRVKGEAMAECGRAWRECGKEAGWYVGVLDGELFSAAEGFSGKFWVGGRVRTAMLKKAASVTALEELDKQRDKHKGHAPETRGSPATIGHSNANNASHTATATNNATSGKKSLITIVGDLSKEHQKQSHPLPESTSNNTNTGGNGAGTGVKRTGSLRIVVPVPVKPVAPPVHAPKPVTGVAPPLHEHAHAHVHGRDVPVATISIPTGKVLQRKKTVRLRLEPTFSPTPPAYDDEDPPSPWTSKGLNRSMSNQFPPVAIHRQMGKAGKKTSSASLGPTFPSTTLAFEGADSCSLWNSKCPNPTMSSRHPQVEKDMWKSSNNDHEEKSWLSKAGTERNSPMKLESKFSSTTASPVSDNGHSQLHSPGNSKGPSPISRGRTTPTSLFSSERFFNRRFLGDRKSAKDIFR